MKQMIGHTLYEGDKLIDIESLSEHSDKVGDLCEDFGAEFGCAQPCKVLGNYHDIGKASDIFGKRVGVILSDGKPIKYDHMMAGALAMLKRFGNTPFGQAMAMAIACHHGGLINYSKKPSELTEKDGLSRDETFMKRDDTYHNNCKTNPDYAIYPEVYQMTNNLSEFCNEIDADHFGLKANGDSYYTGWWPMMTRLFFSCLIDADCLCTEAYYRPSATTDRENQHSSLKELRTRLVNFCNKVCRNDTVINQWRTEIMTCAKRMAPSNKGVFMLEADVGGGKTLAMLMFALMHAINNKMNRVVYVAPFGAVIEQTAIIFKMIFGSNNVCVHHINMDTDAMSMADLMACDNWDAPIVVSSSEQIMDSMYSNRNSRCRKLHNLTNSVILFDEFHEIPMDKMWHTCHAVEALTHSRVYNSSVVLASATLPVMDLLRTTLSTGETKKILSRIPKAIVPKGLVSSPVERVRYSYNHNLNGWQSVSKKAATYKQCMVVVNTRGSAFELAETMKSNGIQNVYHLSASMIPSHREKVLAEVKQRLNDGKDVRLICTSIVQTGVDISFPVVMREMCGWTSLIQVAGRCNRSGEYGVGDCILFPQCGEVVPGLPIKQMDAMKTVLKRFHYDLSQVAKDEKWRTEYWSCYVELYLKDCGETVAFDRNNVQREEFGKQVGDKIIINNMNINFETIACRAKLIDDVQQELLVPLDDESKAIADKIMAASKLTDLDFERMDVSERAKLLVTKSDTRKMQRFAVRDYGNDTDQTADKESKKTTFFDWLVQSKLAVKVDGRRNTYILNSGYDLVYGIARLHEEFKASKKRTRGHR